MEKFAAVVILLTCFVNAKDGLLPDYVTPCDFTAKDLQSCIRKQIDLNLSKFAKGVPELKLDTLDPVDISDVVLDQKNLKLSLSKVKFYGVSKVRVTDLLVDVSKKVSFLKLKFIGNLNLTAKYTADGQILILPIKGRGDAIINTTNVEVEINATLKHVGDKEKGHHLKLVHPTYKYTIGSAKINLTNLFDGNKQLADTMTKFINENWQQLIDEIAPPAIKEIVATIVKSIKKFFAAISNEKLFVNYTGPSV